MQSAIDNIKAIYDYEECKDIARLGCSTGVCSQHIYYGDTIKFFDKYADQVHSYIKDILGVEAIVEIFKQNQGELDMYKNDMTWTFIELVASEVVDEKEEQERNDDEVIGSYQDDEPIKLYAHYTDDEIKVLKANGFNPVRSMTDSRYAQVWLSNHALSRVWLGTHIPYVHPVSQSWQQQKSYNLNQSER